MYWTVNVAELAQTVWYKKHVFVINTGWLTELLVLQNSFKQWLLLLSNIKYLSFGECCLSKKSLMITNKPILLLCNINAFELPCFYLDSFSLIYMFLWGYSSLEKVLGFFPQNKVFVQVSSDFKIGYILSNLCLVFFLALYWHFSVSVIVLFQVTGVATVMENIHFSKHFQEV